MAEFEISDDQDLGYARPVGSIDLVYPASLTKLEVENSVDGGLVYGPEVKAEFAIIDRCINERETSLSALRLEFKCDRNAGVEPGDCLVATETPYRAFWTGVMPLLRGQKDWRLSRPSPGDRAEMHTMIAKSEHDFWETGNKLTAAIEEPMFDKRFEEQGRRAWSGRKLNLGLLPSNGKPWHKALEGAEAALLSSDRLRTLLSKAEKKTLKFGWRGSNQKMSDALSDASSALLWYSVRQALSGVMPNWTEHPERLPVTKCADRIFRNHLELFAKRYALMESVKIADHDQLELYMSTWGKPFFYRYYAPTV